MINPGWKRLSIDKWAKLCLKWRQGEHVSRLSKEFKLSYGQIYKAMEFWGMKRPSYMYQYCKQLNLPFVKPARHKSQ